MLLTSQFIRFVKRHFFKNKSTNKSNPDKLSERPFKKHKDKNPDKIYSSRDDACEETGPPITEMPITGGPHHEEILDDIPK